MMQVGESAGGRDLSGARWNFGDFELDAAGFQLLYRSHPVKLERIPLDLMILLVERQGQLVSRDEIAARPRGHRERGQHRRSQTTSSP
jgi:DNA-binding response OmpR family regulator